LAHSSLLISVLTLALSQEEEQSTLLPKEKRNQGQLQAVADSPQGTKVNYVVLLTFLVFFLSIFTNILFSLILQKLFGGRDLVPRGALGATIIIHKVLEKLCNVLQMCIFSLKYTY
jgi:hypothetical protein